MKILYIYRHPSMGFSIGKVFRPIEEEMRKYAEVDSVYLPIPNYSLKGLWKNIRYAQKVSQSKEYDIIHITGSEHYLIPFLEKNKVIVTVHDLGFYTNQRLSLRTVFKYLLWIKTLKSASKVTFISDKSKAEASKYIHLKKNRTFTIYNPIAPEFVYKEKVFNKECPVILHIGTKPNKNLDNTILALKGFSCKLRIIGKITEEQKMLLDLYHIDYTNDINLTDKQILEEYELCDIVNFPSFYEGFGMPIIEGQSVGRPIITSDLSPMKEIAGKGAVLVNPADIRSIRNGYESVIQQNDTLIKAGTENVERFKLTKIVREYFELYKLEI